MRRHIFAYLGAGLTMAALDAVWLTQAGPHLYRPTLDAILADQFRLGPAIAFYLIYLVGVVGLAVLPAANWRDAARRGALLGLTAYAAFDLTSQSTLKVWATHITVIDMAWGVVLTAVTATAGSLAAGLSRRTAD